MRTEPRQSAAQTWDARLLERIQGGEVERPGRRGSRSWGLAHLHLPLVIITLTGSHRGPLWIFLACVWGTAIAINVGMWLRGRRTKRQAAGVGNPFGR